MSLIPPRPAQAAGTTPLTSSQGTSQAASVTPRADRGNAEPAAAVAQSLRPVRSAEGVSTLISADLDRGHLVESARAQVLAAQRFYTMASLASGRNPLNDPVP